MSAALTKAAVKHKRVNKKRQTIITHLKMRNNHLQRGQWSMVRFDSETRAE